MSAPVRKVVVEVRPAPMSQADVDARLSEALHLIESILKRGAKDSGAGEGKA